MNYIYCHDASESITMLVRTLTEHLAQEKVLWLVSGGSGTLVTIEVANQLHTANLTNLFVTLSDERYGALGHPDENWQHLLDGGLSLPGATLYRPLIGASRDDTTRQFGEWLMATVESVDYVIGLFGIGSDGHTAGIKPGSPAVTAETPTAGYTSEDFERITITPAFIVHVDEALTQAFGAKKHPVIADLLERDVPLTEQPAQLLKTIPISTVFSDLKENHE